MLLNIKLKINIFENREYQLTCVSDTAATLYDTLTDEDATAGPTEFKITFDAGVETGTTYDCSMKLDNKGYTSGKSAPSFVITPDESNFHINLTSS